MRISFTAVGAMLLLSACNTSEVEPEVDTTRSNVQETEAREATPTRVQEAPAEPAAKNMQAPPQGVAVKVQQLGQCRVAPELRRSLIQAMDVADLDGDGRLAFAESEEALNFLVGGLFFRVDANADGKITPEEGKAVRADLAAQYPTARAILDLINEQQAGKALLEVLDSRGEQTVTLDQAKAAARDAVTAVYAQVDTDNDKNIGPEEVEQAIADTSRTLAEKAFKNADGDNNQKLTQEEFRESLDKPLNDAFAAADLNGDGALSKSEAEAMMSWVGDNLRRLSQAAYRQVSEATTVERP